MSYPVYVEKQYLKVWWILAPALVIYEVWKGYVGDASHPDLYTQLTVRAGGLPLFLIFVLILSATFGTMTISVDERFLRWRFGYLKLPMWKVALADISELTIVDIAWIQGYGIRYTREGILYRVSGNQGIRVARKNGKTFRLGTRDPQRLLNYLQPRLMK